MSGNRLTLPLATPNVSIQQNSREYPDFVSSVGEVGFERIVLGTSGARFNSKPFMIWQIVEGSLRLLTRLQAIRKMGIVVAYGNFAYAIKLLARLRLIRYEKLFCFAFFVHSPAWFPVFRVLSRLDAAKDQYVIFSESEIDSMRNNSGLTGAGCTTSPTETGRASGNRYR